MAKNHKVRYKFVDLFSGIGGFRVACEKLGGQCVAYSEIDSKAINVYKENFNTKRELELGDITKIKSYPNTDILLGGVPCQSWSIAGKMKGFEDPRGRLWLDTINFTKKVKPKGFVYENVKGLADPRNKKNLDLIVSEFNKIGYNTYYSVLNAFDFGLPQSRERLFIVGIRKDIDTNSFTFPSKFDKLPFLSDILESSKNSNNNYVSNHSSCKNGFNMAAVVNKGNFYIFSDVRNGDYTIHSWDLIKTTKKEKAICLRILKNRRKPKYGEKDGNPMSARDIIDLFSNKTLLGSDDYEITTRDINKLVNKNILRKVDNKYEFANSKISSGINGVYRIFLPESHIFSTLTKSGSRDYIAETSVPSDIKDRNSYFINEIYKKNKYRQITVREAARLQGFPDKFVFSTKYNVSLGLLGNAVAVNVVELIMKNLLSVVNQQ